jgi:hypothetical protein
MLPQLVVVYLGHALFCCRSLVNCFVSHRLYINSVRLTILLKTEKKILVDHCLRFTVDGGRLDPKLPAGKTSQDFQGKFWCAVSDKFNAEKDMDWGLCQPNLPKDCFPEPSMAPTKLPTTAQPTRKPTSAYPTKAPKGKVFWFANIYISLLRFGVFLKNSSAVYIL